MAFLQLTVVVILYIASELSVYQLQSIIPFLILKKCQSAELIMNLNFDKIIGILIDLYNYKIQLGSNLNFHQRDSTNLKLSGKC